MAIFIALIIIVAVIEMFLDIGRDIWYFKSGVPVYWKISQGPVISFPVISSHKIESLVQHKDYAEVQFRNARDNFFIFMETAPKNYRFIALLYGNLIIDPKIGQVKVIGRLKWSVFLVFIFLIFIIFSSYTKEDHYRLFAIMVFIVMGVICLYHVNRFGQIADRVAKNLKELESVAFKTEETN
jgi:hypothetical protein